MKNEIITITTEFIPSGCTFKKLGGALDTGGQAKLSFKTAKSK